MRTTKCVLMMAMTLQVLEVHPRKAARSLANELADLSPALVETLGHGSSRHAEAIVEQTRVSIARVGNRSPGRKRVLAP
ncbi:MAG TPA: hypothetical protein VFX59_15450 [Polyangiales bacterium]|nr:hypothetical protein [Polyangiales bacterium]